MVESVMFTWQRVVLMRTGGRGDLEKNVTRNLSLDKHSPLEKMSHYGIRGIALEWFQSYLTGRTQFVEYNDTKSETLHMSNGQRTG